jgi:hypothetical protein
MKKILCLMLVTLLVSCSSVKEIIFASPYDPHEYTLITKIRTETTFMSCSNDEVTTLYRDALELKNTSQYIPHNEKIAEVTVDFLTMVDELYKKDKPGDVYCKAKLSVLSYNAEKLQKVIGGKSR